MASPFRKTTGADVPLNGVDQYGGAESGEVSMPVSKTSRPFNGDCAMADGSLPKGVNQYGGTEDFGELGEAAKKHGIKRIPGFS